MKKLIVLLLAFCLVGCNEEVITNEVYGIKIGMTPQEVNEVLGHPQYQFVRGYFYDSERGFYWERDGRWIWVGFYDYETEPNDFRVWDFSYTPKPQIGQAFEPSTCGIQIILPMDTFWIPFPISDYESGNFNFPKNYKKYIASLTSTNEFMSDKSKRK